MASSGYLRQVSDVVPHNKRVKLHRLDSMKQWVARIPFHARPGRDFASSTCGFEIHAGGISKQRNNTNKTESSRVEPDYWAVIIHLHNCRRNWSSGCGDWPRGGIPRILRIDLLFFATACELTNVKSNLVPTVQALVLII